MRNFRIGFLAMSLIFLTSCSSDEEELVNDPIVGVPTPIDQDCECTFRYLEIAWNSANVRDTLVDNTMYNYRPSTLPTNYNIFTVIPRVQCDEEESIEQLYPFRVKKLIIDCDLD